MNRHYDVHEDVGDVAFRGAIMRMICIICMFSMPILCKDSTVFRFVLPE